MWHRAGSHVQWAQPVVVLGLLVWDEYQHYSILLLNGCGLQPFVSEAPEVVESLPVYFCLQRTQNWGSVDSSIQESNVKSRGQRAGAYSSRMMPRLHFLLSARGIVDCRDTVKFRLVPVSIATRETVSDEEKGLTRCLVRDPFYFLVWS